MAQTTLSELTYNGQKVIVEVARRDAKGHVIDTTYQTSVQVNSAIVSALKPYATVTWVQNQGYLTRHQDISGKLDVTTFNNWIGTTAPATYVAIDGFKANYLDGNKVAYKADIPSLAGYATQSWVTTQLASYATTSNTYTKSQVDSLVTTLKKNSYQVVKTKPTTGEEGITYLVGSAAPYEMWIYEGAAWIDLGSTSIDLSGYVPTSRKVNGHALTADVTVTKGDVGLGNVVNTGDSATPVVNGTTKFTTGGAFTLQTSIAKNAADILGTKNTVKNLSDDNATNKTKISALETTVAGKQDKLIAGKDILIIDGNTIACNYSNPVTATDVTIDLA